MSKSVAIKDFLTDAQAKAAVLIWTTDRANFHKRVIAEIIEPNMAEINRKLGQENVAGFLAYALEYAIGAAEGAR